MKFVLAFIVIICQSTTVHTLCRRTNDQKNYTCTNAKFYQLRTSPNQKQNILHSTIDNCNEKEIPETVLPFQNLEYLKISCGSIEVVHKNAFSNLPKLEELNLDNNTISGFPNGVFESLTQLKKLKTAKLNGTLFI